MRDAKLIGTEDQQHTSFCSFQFQFFFPRRVLAAFVQREKIYRSETTKMCLHKLYFELLRIHLHIYYIFVHLLHAERDEARKWWRRWPWRWRQEMLDRK